ncbi:MAG: hypothetical protein HYX81_03665 [Chloroflexi bacterium]|nr:hypothetical protein [Chloroflexota bacterium]
MPVRKPPIKDLSFDVSDERIHTVAVDILLGERDLQMTLSQGSFAYCVRGGSGGHLYYRKRVNDEWVLIANWCFYGLYIVVRYRKPVRLRPMYETLFTRMHFASVTFEEYSIKLLGSDGEVLRSRRFQLIPPSAFRKVMSEKFGFSEEKIESLQAEMGL